MSMFGQFSYYERLIDKYVTLVEWIRL